MATQWTLAAPHEPNVSPFLASEFNSPGNFEARRTTMLDGIARIHAQWFRDGFSNSTPELFVDLVKIVHARGMKMLAIARAATNDFTPDAYLDKEKSGCSSGAFLLSRINLATYQTRIEAQFALVRAANETIEAFEIGNELDLHCNDADSPDSAEWAKHNWKWFLSPAQVDAFVRGYGPFLQTSVASIRKFFPHAKIITYGNSLVASAPLMEALAKAKGPDGKAVDYTALVDGYGVHLYPTTTTTQAMVEEASGALLSEASHFPHLDQKSIWITEWNPSASSWWNGKPWYFQYDAQGHPGGELNKADAQGQYRAMDRADAVGAFNRDVVERLRSSAQKPVNISHVFFYDYDSGAQSPKCDHVSYGWNPKLTGWCADGVIDPTTGALITGLAAAITGRSP